MIQQGASTMLTTSAAAIHAIMSQSCTHIPKPARYDSIQVGAARTCLGFLFSASFRFLGGRSVNFALASACAAAC
jgi:hypothetical protein